MRTWRREERTTTQRASLNIENSCTDDPTLKTSPEYNQDRSAAGTSTARRWLGTWMGFWPPPLARPVRPASSAAPAAVESTVCSHPAPITLPLTYLTPTSVCSLAEALLLVLGGLGGLLLRLLLRCGLAGVLSLLGLSVRQRKRGLLVGGEINHSLGMWDQCARPC